MSFPFSHRRWFGAGYGPTGVGEPTCFWGALWCQILPTVAWREVGAKSPAHGVVGRCPAACFASLDSGLGESKNFKLFPHRTQCFLPRYYRGKSAHCLINHYIPSFVRVPQNRAMRTKISSQQTMPNHYSGENAICKMNVPHNIPSIRGELL